MKRYDVRLAGLGGQGLLLAGLILGEAAAVFDGKNATQTVNYAPLARGAPSRSEVAVSSEPIYFPEVEEADILLAMSQDAYDSFKDEMKSDGLIIVDTDNVNHYDKDRVKAYPITTMAQESTGKAITASMVGLGVISKLTGVVSADALKETIKVRAPKGTGELNNKALAAGLEVQLN